MPELGNTLSRARRARGITLEDAERDTHVSKRYLQALENEDFSAFPAPVYARGFLRTYARYVGLNPEELMRVFPSQELTVDITPLPTIAKPAAHTVSMNWLVTAGVAVFLLGAAFLLISAGGDTATVENSPRIGQTVTSATTNGASQQVIQPALAATPGGQVQGRTIGPVTPGELPNMVGADEASALSVLRDIQIQYVVITSSSPTVPSGLIISQSPGPGTRTSEETQVTLVVSRGP